MANNPLDQLCSIISGQLSDSHQTLGQLFRLIEPTVPDPCDVPNSQCLVVFDIKLTDWHHRNTVNRFGDSDMKTVSNVWV